MLTPGHLTSQKSSCQGHTPLQVFCRALDCEQPQDRDSDEVGLVEGGGCGPIRLHRCKMGALSPTSCGTHRMIAPPGAHPGQARLVPGPCCSHIGPSLVSGGRDSDPLSLWSAQRDSWGARTPVLGPSVTLVRRRMLFPVSALPVKGSCRCYSQGQHS